VLIRDYPICKHLIKDIHTMRSPESIEIKMTDELLQDYLNQGFKWMHVSELDTWY